ncbi:hypothetical protein H5410_048654 [Solanum commersonii]|uniref:SWIM-type domain-containing protein n=1 Tax=Solanum commersonii TaxID=4109 RepID=A0A9J5XLP9_SOLCO|nr:hypothetical protein H5410_048654 [Solanum commersonii]
MSGTSGLLQLWQVPSSSLFFGRSKLSKEHIRCTCRLWDLSGIPCPHAINAFMHKNVVPETQIHWFYSKEAYLLTYKHKIQPVRGIQFWNVDPAQAMEPPDMIKTIGRPKKKRDRTTDEARKRKGLYLVPVRVMYPMPCFCKQMQTTTYAIVKGSYVSNPQNQQENKEKLTPQVENVGAFQKLPMVMPSVDILHSALRKARRVSPTKGIANAAKRERNKGAKQLDALMKELAVPLRTYKENFPNKKYLHPYERSLIELTLGDGNYEDVLGKLEALRKKVVSVGKEHASLCAKSSSKREAEERLNEGLKRIEEIFDGDGKAVDELLNIAKTLRAMPVVDLETPTLCLVGAPNVGKSSLVRVLSTGKPELFYLACLRVVNGPVFGRSGSRTGKPGTG